MDIAVIIPLSGPNATVGEMIVNATKLAVEDINSAGGIKSLGGAKLNPIIADATNDPQGAVTTTERVLSQNKLAGAYGLALSPLTTAALPAFVKHHVPVVTSIEQQHTGDVEQRRLSVSDSAEGDGGRQSTSRVPQVPQ